MPSSKFPEIAVAVKRISFLLGMAKGAGETPMYEFHFRSLVIRSLSSYGLES